MILTDSEAHEVWMIPLADGLFLLKGFPRNVFNIYLMNDILIDSGTPFDRRRILRQLKGRTVTAHALTHAHPDHLGASRPVCKALGLPLWCGEADADAAEDPKLIASRLPQSVFTRLIGPHMEMLAQPVSRRLREGDEVGGFTVLEVPGHSAGHVAYWRASDRTLILGDVVNNINMLTGRPGLRMPPARFTPDPARNRRSARRLAMLEPALICFGHGPPLSDTGKFERFVATLKDE